MWDNSHIAFAVISLTVLGAFLILACLILGMLISIGIHQYMGKGWSFFEALKKSWGEFK